MIRRATFVLFALLLGAALIVPLSCSRGTAVRDEAAQPNHADTGFSAPDFYRAVSLKITRPTSNQNLAGGVVPHHLLASQLIAGYFSILAQQQPEVIFIVGPNHHNRGGRLLTGHYGWETPFGVVATETDAIQQLRGSGMVEVNEEVLGQEHSIGNLMPFVKYYLPRARVVPLILHRDVSPEETERLAKMIGQLGKNVVLIASVDFSHYLTAREAEIKDRDTLEAMRGYSLDRLWKMDNDHLDSPPSLILLLQAMKNNNNKEFDVAEHTNSGLLLGNEAVETTSYFTLHFGERQGTRMD